MYHKDSKTKIVATIGPSSENILKLKALINHGVDIFRLNFKHNTIDWHAEIIKRIKSLKSMYKKPGEFPGIMLDLQGPSIRLILSQNSIVLKPNQPLIITDTPKASNQIGFTYPNLDAYLQEGDTIYADDGQFQFSVKKDGKTTLLVPHEGGELITKKSVNLPGIYKRLDIKPLTDRDLQGLKLALLEQVELVAISFVRSIRDILYVHEKIAEFKEQLHLEASNFTPQIVAKIETMEGVENIEEITIASDIIMVARGDLAIETGFYAIPYYQAKIVQTANNYKRPVIIATQMLKSMTTNYLPTRAEITDVGHAVENRADAIMFSEETAIGHHPTRVVEVAQKILNFTEKRFTEIEPVQINIQDFSASANTTIPFNSPLSSQAVEAINTMKHTKYTDFQLAEYNLSTAAYHLYLKHADTVQAFIVFTKTGKKATYLSKYKPNVPIIAFVPNAQTYGLLKLAYNVFPVLASEIDYRNIKEQNILNAIKYLKTHTSLIKPGKHLISVYTKQIGYKINPRVLEIIPI